MSYVIEWGATALVYVGYPIVNLMTLLMRYYLLVELTGATAFTA